MLESFNLAAYLMKNFFICCQYSLALILMCIFILCFDESRLTSSPQNLIITLSLGSIETDCVISETML